MSIRNTYPTIRPSLNLDFARSRTLDPRITFSRTTTGTYMDSDGLIKVASADEARFDHKYEDGNIVSLGLLVEEERTNIVRKSEDLTIGRWSEVGDGVTVTTNQAVAPDGNTTADKVVIKTTDTGGKGIQSSILIVGLSTGTAITSSIFCKADDHNYVRVQMEGGGNSVGIVVDLSDGSLVSEWSSPDSHNIEPYPNDWYRISVTSTTANTAATALRVFLTDASGNALFIGTVGNGVFMWGGQHEVGAFATSYIPTDDTAGGKTREPDNASMTGNNFSDWYNSSEWTLMIGARRNYAGNFIGYPNLARINDGTDNNRVVFYGADASNQFTNYGVNSGGTNYTTYVARSIPTTAPFKMIQALKKDSSTFGVDGTMTTTDTSVEMPVGVNQLLIGVGSWGGTISKLSYYPRRLSNSQLQNLTK